MVEKTSEAEELEQLCNKYSPDRNIAKAISAPNDYNLSQGRCPNGTATSYEECLGHSCLDYADCPLVQSASQTRNTPMLIMLQECCRLAFTVNFFDSGEEECKVLTNCIVSTFGILEDIDYPA